MRFDSATVRLLAKRIGVYALLLLFLAAIGAVSMILGKGHRFIVDNKPMDGNAAAPLVTVRVDGGDPVELTPGVRDVALVSGQTHSLSFDFGDGKPPVVKQWEFPFTWEYVIVYVSRVKAGVEPWIEFFDPYSADNRALAIKEDAEEKAAEEGEVDLGAEDLELPSP